MAGNYQDHLDYSYKRKIYSCFVKTLPAQLTPFVRSDTVGSLLAETLSHIDREFTLTELGRRVGAGPAVVHREVGRLVDGGILKDRHEGRNRLVSANVNHPLFVPMRTIIETTYGPVPILREAFGEVDGATLVYIYGSWAARRSGVAGPFPNDIDVLVVGATPRRVLADIARSAGDRLGVPVNITRVSPEEWTSNEPSPFLATVQSRPTVNVLTGELNE